MLGPKLGEGDACDVVQAQPMGTVAATLPRIGFMPTSPHVGGKEG